MRKLNTLKKMCDEKGYRLLDISFRVTGKVLVYAQEINEFTKPNKDFIYGDINYQLLYNTWVKEGTRILSSAEDFDDAVQRAIQYLKDL